jgi:hypothetical protein
MIKYFISFFILISVTNIYSQVDRERVGTDQMLSQQGAYFNFGDKDKVNIEVSVWGYARYPGRYLIPKGTTVQDLISYSGGPVVDTKVEDIRLYRPKNDSLNITQDQVIKLNYNDLFWEERIRNVTRENPVLMPGDVLIFPGEPRLFFRDNLSLILNISSILISLGILVISIVRN